MDILVKNAKLREKSYLVNIAINNGIIASILPAKSDLIVEIEKNSEHIIDAKGNLVSPTFIDPHIHLDNSLLPQLRQNMSGTIAEADEIIMETQQALTANTIIDNASKAIKMGILNGVTKFRTHVDINPAIGLKNLESILEVRKIFKNIVDIQIAVFPRDGLFKDQKNRRLMKKAMKKGANIVGGIPQNERTYENTIKHMDYCFKLAKDFNASIDMHIDATDDPSSRNIEYLADITINNKYNGRVTADHVCALAAYDDSYAAKIIPIIKDSRINIITTPTTDLIHQGRYDKEPIKRGITRVKQLINAGINVAYGQDYIMASYNPTWGREHLLEVGMLTAFTAKLTSGHEIEKLFDMPTYNSAKILELKDYGISEGTQANLNILNAVSIQEAFRNLSDCLYVISNGKIIAETNITRTLNSNI